MLVNGDKLVVTKGVMGVLEEGDIVEVVDVNENGMISFAFGEGYMHKGLMNVAECEEHFELYEEPEEVLPPKVTSDIVEDIINNSHIEMYTAFDRCTVVICELPNGFILVEYSPCMSPEYYSEEVGFNNCMGRIREKIWELESYVLKEVMYEERLEKESNEYTNNELDCNDCELRNECLYNYDDDYKERNRDYDNDDCDCWCE